MKKTTLTPQCSAVLSELRAGKRTTRQLARATGSMRVGAIVHVLRMAGFNIHTEIIRVPTRYSVPANVALYTLRKRKVSTKRRAA